MKHKTTCLLFLFSILLLFTPTHAIPRITFSHIGTDQGLSQSSVFDVTQDRFKLDYSFCSFILLTAKGFVLEVISAL